MIGHFPDPYPGELIYSVCARFAERMKFPDFRRTMEALFNDPIFVPTVDMPNNLDALIASLPPGHSYTSDQLIERHTLFPLYGPFLRAENYRLVRENMKRSGFRTTQLRTGIIAGGVHMPQWLRCCPECDVENEKAYGETFWNRLHQAPGVEVCPVHKVFLESTNVRRQSPQHRHNFVSAQPLSRSSVSRSLDLSHPIHRSLLKIAEDVAWLLDQGNLASGLPVIHQRYLDLLVQKGLAIPTGKVKLDQLHSSFLSQYPRELLQLFQSDIPTTECPDWILRLIRKPKGIQAPVRHLLMMQFLGVTAREFFNLPAKTERFGYGPFPCLNRVCSSYKKPVIQQHSTRYSHFTKRLVGRFTCPTCGQVYERWHADPHVVNEILDYGPIWRGKLTELWSDSSIGICKLARRLGVDPFTAKRHAFLLGLPFPRKAKCRVVNLPTKVRLPEPPHKRNLLASKRARWLCALQAHPEKSCSELRRANHALHTWLYRNDGEWLKSHQPRKRIPRAVSPRVDWNKRDPLVASKIMEAINRLKSSLGKGKRITISLISREAGTFGLLKHIERLPQSKAVLESNAESIEDFAVRRINAVRDAFLAARQRPTRSAFMYRAGLSAKVKRSGRVRLAIENALNNLFENTQPCVEPFLSAEIGLKVRCNGAASISNSPPSVEHDSLEASSIHKGLSNMLAFVHASKTTGGFKPSC